MLKKVYDRGKREKVEWGNHSPQDRGEVILQKIGDPND